MITVAVEEDSQGIRLDRFLTAMLPGRSRSQVQQLIRDDHVRVDGKPSKANHLVQVRQIVTVEIPPPVESAPVPFAAVP